MNNFEDWLFPELSLEDRAAAFMHVKYAGAAPKELDEERAEYVKQAASHIEKRAEGEDDLIGGTSMPSPTPPATPGGNDEQLARFLEEEQAGREAEQAHSTQYYVDRLREMGEQMGVLQQQLEAVTQENEANKAELGTIQETIATTQQEGQLAQQAAVQNAQSANVAAQQAMAQAQQHLADATQAKLQLQQMRAAMLELASADPAIPGMGAPQNDLAAAGASADPAATGAAPADPNQQQSMPPTVEGTPTGDPASPSSSSEPQSGTQSPGGPGGDGKVSTKVGMHPALAGGLLGGAAGAGLAGLEASGHGPDLDALRAEIAQGEEKMRQPGLRGFAHAFELAKQKATLTLGEATQAHPVAATVAGGALGALAGATAGPGIASGLREAASYYKRSGAVPGVAALLGK